MSLPSELEKPIDEIKTPSNKILVICLISAVMAMGGVIVWLSKSGNSSLNMQLVSCQALNEKKDVEIQRLNNYIIEEAKEDIRWQREREAKMDSIVQKFKNLNLNTPQTK